MTHKEYLKLGKELQTLSKTAPLNWGSIQNNVTDRKIDMFSCPSLEDLDSKIRRLSTEDQNYFRRRWFIWKCSQVDEYLFYRESNVKKNANSMDKCWDIEFNNAIRFDLKGTVVPKALRTNFTTNKEKEIINFYYSKQSKGIRFDIQNRLFVVHHSFRKEERSIFLRCHWKLKEEAYKEFNKRLTNSEINLIEFSGITAKCIFILETSDKDFVYEIR